MVTDADESPYDFAGAVGFARQSSWDATVQYTYVGVQYESTNIKPQATFDLTFSSTNSTVTIGEMNFDETEWATTMHSHDLWSLDVAGVYFNSSKAVMNTNSIPAILASDFPYVAIPSALYNDYLANLTDLGFICESTADNQTNGCVTNVTCDSIVNSMLPLNIEVNFNDGETVLEI